MKKVLSFCVLSFLASAISVNAQTYVDDRYMNHNLPDKDYQNNKLSGEGEYDNAYIDYDDDSYTTRMRRFHHPMMGAGYYGSIYSPYYYDPFYYDPFNYWGGWFRPRITFSFGFGPYWSNCWGTSMWMGYPSFGWGWGMSPYYSPWGWGGYGMGYGGGFWNGYYSGFYDGLGYGNNWGSQNHYSYHGPRGIAGTNVNTSGTYGINTRGNHGGIGLNTNPRTERTTINNNNLNSIRSGSNATRVQSTTNPIIRNQSNNEISNPRSGNRNNQLQNIQTNPSQNRNEIRSTPPVRNNRSNMEIRGNDRSMQTPRSTPSRQFSTPPTRTAPTRSYSSPAPSRSYSSPVPSRSYSSPAPSRSFSSPSPSRSNSGSFGGGSRSGGSSMSGGRR